MLSPQKNRAGQRTYRRRDVEIALRIKELLYEELYTIAGAKKKLLSELRETPKLKVVSNEPQKPVTPQRDFEVEAPAQSSPPPVPVQSFTPRPSVTNFSNDNFDEADDFDHDFESNDFDSEERRNALKTLTAQLSELRQILANEEDAPRNRW